MALRHQDLVWVTITPEDYRLLNSVEAKVGKYTLWIDTGTLECGVGGHTVSSRHNWPGSVEKAKRLLVAYCNQNDIVKGTKL